MSRNPTPDVELGVEQHRRVFRTAPTVVASAPGRVNLIGEHVDYNDGLVLPFAIDRRVVAAAAPSATNEVTVFSDALNAMSSFPLTVSDPVDPPSWENYVRGVVAGLRNAGARLSGATLWIGGDLAPGSGLSSSAALCVAIGGALTRLAEFEVGALELARISQAAEHKYAGTPCGIMDPYVSCFGREGHALLLDCRGMTHEYVRLALVDHSLVVIPSGVKHTLSAGAYARRVEECQAAVRAIAVDCPEVTSLRDVSLEMWESCRDRLDAVVAKRAFHVITEIARVRSASGALQACEWRRFGDLLWETQDSLRDNYEVSCPEVDELISMMRNFPGVLGARMVGGGFGGVLLALVENERVAALSDALVENYYRPRGVAEEVFTVSPCSGETSFEIPPA